MKQLLNDPDFRILVSIGLFFILIGVALALPVVLVCLAGGCD